MRSISYVSYDGIFCASHMVIKITLNSGRTLSQLIKDLYYYFPDYKSAPLHKFVHIDSLIKKSAGLLNPGYIYSELINNKSYMAVELPIAEGVYIHPETAKKLIKRFVLKKLEPAIRATKKIANRSTKA